MGWEIKGESGKALNATLRTTESLNIDVHTLQLQTLADDSYVWTAATSDATGAGTIVPAVGQVVEVFADGVRRFRGHAMKPQVGLTSVRVEVLGPWYWLNVVDLTGEIEDAEGDSGERTSFVFPTQGLRTSIISLIERMIDKGVPIALGDIDIMYTCPKMTLSNMSFASALAELMRWAPHCVAWFDYTGASGGMPILNVTRRDNLVGTTFTVGTSLLEDVRIQPRLDLQVTETRLKYVTRNPTTGKPKWASQSAGTGGAGSRQIMTISGPEIVDFLPKDDFDSVKVQTVDWKSVSSDFIRANDSQLASIKASFGSAPGARYSAISFYSGDVKNKVYTSIGLPALTRRAINGKAFKTAQKWLVISNDTLPEWAVKQLNAIEVELTGTWGSYWTLTTAWSKAFIALQQGGTLYKDRWRYETSVGSASTERIDWVVRPFTVRGWLVNQSFAALTTVYKEWDYEYLTPPSNLSADLRDAQNWVPWEGQIVTVADSVSGYNALQRKFNVAGSYAAHATMDAMCRSVTYEVHRGRTIYDLGAPARTDLGGLVGRVRRDPQDNIVYL